MLYPLVVLIIVALAIFSIARRGRAEGSVLARRISLFGSLAVLVPFLAVFSLPLLYLAERFIPWLHVPSTVPFGYAWWQYPFPIAAAIIATVAALIALRRSAGTPEVPVAPIAPRGWTSFANRRQLTVAIVSAVVLIAVSVTAGLASVTNDYGLHTLIELPGPVLEDGGASGGLATFYGWAYSVPVMVGAIVLLVLLWLALRASALPAFRRPDTVEHETLERRQIASALLRLYTAALLLPLGGALIQIGDAGMGSTGIGIPGVGDFMWSLGYSAFAPAIMVIGNLVQIAGVFILLRSVFGRRERAAVAELAVP